MKQRLAVINSVWLVLLVPALAFYALWFSDRSYSYTWVTDIDTHAASFGEKVLPAHDPNRTKVIEQGFREAVLEPFFHHRRVSFAAHTWMAGTTAIAMMLNLMPWVRTRSCTLHKALGYYVMVMLPVMMTQLAIIWTVFGQVPVGFAAWISTPIILTEMAVSLYIGFKAARARQWMKHRAAMIFCTAALTYVCGAEWTFVKNTIRHTDPNAALPRNSVQQGAAPGATSVALTSPVSAQNDLPRPVSTWAEHCDLVQDITTYMAMVTNNLVAAYFAFCTVPRDARVQAKLAKVA